MFVCEGHLSVSLKNKQNLFQQPDGKEKISNRVKCKLVFSSWKNCGVNTFLFTSLNLRHLWLVNVNHIFGWNESQIALRCCEHTSALKLQHIVLTLFPITFFRLKFAIGLCEELIWESAIYYRPHAADLYVKLFIYIYICSELFCIILHSLSLSRTLSLSLFLSHTHTLSFFSLTHTHAHTHTLYIILILCWYIVTPCLNVHYVL